MKKYMVTMMQGEIVSVPVSAADEKKAVQKARREFDEGNYSETGELSVRVLGIGKIGA